MNLNKLFASSLKTLLIIVLSMIISGCGTVPTPQLTAEDRKKDIEYLAEWARDYSPLVELAEKHKGNPSYEALLPKYLDYAEQAESNEEFYQVVRGYYNLICSAGHHNLTGERTQKLCRIGILLGIIDLDINSSMINQACYWSRLANGNLFARARPPFHIVYEDDKYITQDEWEVDSVTVLQGSQIIRVNGMDCATYLDYVTEKTSLKYDAFSKVWTKNSLLVLNDGDELKGWQVDFRLPDNSLYSTFVPKMRVYSFFVPRMQGFPAPKKERTHTINPKENCTCIELSDEIAYIRIKSMMPGGLWELIFPSIYKKDRKTIKSFLENAHGKYHKLIKIGRASCRERV